MQTTTPDSADPASYARLVEPFRDELHAHCCRMLRSSDDAEDALQEALLRAWRGLPSFEGRSSLRAWLYRISTNSCLDAIERRKRVLPLDGGSPFEVAVGDDGELEPVDHEPMPEVSFERRESLELAVAAAFEHLSPRARTVFVLRTALGFRAQEVAALLDTSVASVNSALQRARATLDGEADPAAGRDRGARVGQCADAIARGDANAVVSLLDSRS